MIPGHRGVLFSRVRNHDGRKGCSTPRGVEYGRTIIWSRETSRLSGENEECPASGDDQTFGVTRLDTEWNHRDRILSGLETVTNNSLAHTFFGKPTPGLVPSF